MAVQYRYGNNYRLALGQETEYGSGYTNATAIRFDDLTVLPDTINFTHEPGQIDTGAKTQVGLNTACEFKPGYLNNTVTLSGYLSHEHEFLLAAHGLTESPSGTYTLDSLPSAQPSYVILRIWSDAASTPYVADKWTGCMLTSFSINGTSGDLLRYEATFLCADFTREIAAQAITGSDPGTICTEGFNYGDLTATLNFGDKAHLKSFSLTLTHELADDATQFQNSNTRLEVIPVKSGGELSYVTNYDADSAVDKAGESHIYSGTPLVEELEFANTSYTWTLTLNGQVTSYTLADPANALFDNSVTERLIHTAGAEPIEVVVAAVVA